MKKKISKRRLKVINKNKHNEVMKSILEKYTLTRQVFGDGYFIFSFDVNTISWFFLKEFPEWKFAIWLNEEGYDIFGESIVQIDKFKPTASTLSEENVIPFLVELEKIKNNEGEWKEYNLETIYQQDIEDKENAMTRRNIDKLTRFIEIEQEKYENDKVSSCFELIDRNTDTCSVSPRYLIQEYIDPEIEGYDNSEKAKDRTAKVFDKMSNLIEYVGNWPNGKIDYDREYLNPDDILFEHRYLENPKDFLESEIRYERKEPITKFEDLVIKFRKSLD